MMNTNSKILPSQDSNLSCYSPSTLTFSAPAFYLSSFLILVDQTSTNWKIAPIKIAQGVGVGLGLGLGNSLGAIFRGAILLVPVKGKPHFKAKFSPFKNRTVTWRNAYPSKRAHCFNLLFLFCSQRRKESLNVSNFFYRLTFQPREKYSNFSKTKRKKKRSMIIKKWPCNAAFIIKYLSSHYQQNNKNVCMYRENNDVISFCRHGFSFCMLIR